MLVVALFLATLAQQLIADHSYKFCSPVNKNNKTTQLIRTKYGLSMNRFHPSTRAINSKTLYFEATLTFIFCSSLSVLAYSTGITTHLSSTLASANYVGFIILVLLYVVEFRRLELNNSKKQILFWLPTASGGILLGILIAESIGNGQLDMTAISTIRLLFVMLLTAACLIYYFYSRENKLKAKERVQEKQLQQSQQDKLLLVSQLQVLKNQVEPHFLFNTLANLQAMILTDEKKAIELLELLTRMLRQSLKGSKNTQVTIKDEMEFIRSYLAIHKFRLGERLEYSVKIAEEVESSTLIPPLLLQPLVENAIKYGIEPAETGGKVEVYLCKPAENRLNVIIKNSGIGFHQEADAGLGLINIRQRFHTLFGLDSQLNILENSSGGVTVEMEFPL